MFSTTTRSHAAADYFEAVARGRDGKTAANWVINDLLGALNKAGKKVRVRGTSYAVPLVSARAARALDGSDEEVSSSAG